MLLNLYSVPKCPCNVKSVYILTTLTCIHIFQTDWIPKKTKKNGNIVCLNWKKKKKNLWFRSQYNSLLPSGYVTLEKKATKAPLQIKNR